MGESKEAVNTIGSLIPQFFFDVIGRFIPGAFLLGIFTIVALGPRHFWERLLAILEKQSWALSSSVMFVAATAIASYVITVILGGLWAIQFKFVQKIPVMALIWGKEEPNIAHKYDFIRYKSDAIGNRVAKIRAEIEMTSILTTGFVIALLVNTALLSSFNDWPRLLLDCFLLTSIVGTLGAMSYIRSCYIYAIRNHCDLLEYQSDRSDGAALRNETLGQMPIEASAEMEKPAVKLTTENSQHV